MGISNQNQGLKPGVCTFSTRPTAPYTGMMIYETDTNLSYIWNGSSWAQMPSSASLALKANIASPTFTGTTTVTGTASNVSNTINAPSGYYAIQYFAINGTSRWHYEIPPSYNYWALVETGVAQRMTVNATTGNTTFTGAVTASGSPSVYAVRGSNLAYNNAAQNVPIIYDSTSVNVGSHYNTSNGLFTTPLAGDYAVSCGVLGNADVSQLWTVINGVRGVSIVLSSSGGASNMAGAGVVRLNVGDTFGMAAWFGGNTQTIIANGYHTFLRIRYIG
jgi:hypothetical protein